MIKGIVMGGEPYTVPESEEEKAKADACVHGDVTSSSYYGRTMYECGYCGSALTLSQVTDIVEREMVNENRR